MKSQKPLPNALSFSAPAIFSSPNGLFRPPLRHEMGERDGVRWCSGFGGTILSLIAILALATGCTTHETMGNAGEKLDMSTFYLPNTDAMRIVSVTTGTNAPFAAQVYIQTHAVAVKETGPKETVAKFGEVYAFSPNFLAVHRDEPTLIHFLNLQPDDNHDFLLYTPDQVFMKVLLPPLQDTSFVFTFHREGLFNFLCAMHQPSMTGQILVLPPKTQ
jgi:plastocyanin